MLFIFLIKIVPLCNGTIQFNQSFYKQIDGCAIGDPLSVILADVRMVRTENEVVKPISPPFCERLVNDIYSRTNKKTSFLQIKNMLKSILMRMTSANVSRALCDRKNAWLKFVLCS